MLAEGSRFGTLVHFISSASDWYLVDIGYSEYVIENSWRMLYLLGQNKGSGRIHALNSFVTCKIALYLKEGERERETKTEKYQ